MSDVPSSASTAEERASPPAARGLVYPGTPRWVKVGAIVAVVLVLLVVLVMVVGGGEHGPMRHIPSAAGTHTIAAIAVGL